MPIASVGDIQLNFTIHGEGREWVVLIGGYASGNWQAWGSHIDTLAKNFRVLAFDNRGIGASDVPRYPYTTKMMASDTARLMQYVGIKRAHLLGKSLGGCIAQWVAIDNPELVGSLVMTSTLARPQQRFSQMVRWWVQSATHIGFERLFPGLLTYFYSAPYYDANIESIQRAEIALCKTPRSIEGFVNTGNAAMTHDSWSRLSEIKCPTLLLCGSDDIITTAAHTREMGAAIPGAEVRIIPDTLHGFLTERPHTFQMIVDFFMTHQLNA